MDGLNSHKERTIQAYKMYMDALGDSTNEIDLIMFSVRNRQSNNRISPQFESIESLYLWLNSEPSIISGLDTQHSIAREVFLK